MKLRDYLMNISTEELTERLIYLDKAIQELHNGNYYVVGDLADIEIINNEITLDSFKDKIDYLDSGINDKGRNKNIIELSAIGISAYNKLSVLHTSKDFINYVANNVEMFLEHGNMPSYMQEYYIDIFDRNKVDYLNNFLLQYRNSDGKLVNLDDYRNDGSSRNNSRGAYTKSTAVGRALADKENAAFASVLLLPALLALIYIIAVVVYFVFVR